MSSDVSHNDKSHQRFLVVNLSNVDFYECSCVGVIIREGQRYLSKKSNLCFPKSECTCRQIVNIKTFSPVLVVYLSNVNFYEVNILYIYT